MRWRLDATKVVALAIDNAIGLSTAYRYLAEALDVIAAQAPALHEALEEAKASGYRHVAIDGTVVATDRCRPIGPTRGVDLWWSGNHHHHGGNVRVVTAPDGQRSTMLLPVRGKRNGARAIDTQTYDAVQTALRALAERGNALLKMTYAALRHVTIGPGRIGAMTAAAFVILHLEHHSTV